MSQDLIISKHCGIDFPTEEMATLEARHGAELTSCLVAAKAQQTLFAADMLIGNDFNDSLKSRFLSLCDGILMLKLVFSVSENWHECLYLLKDFANRFFAMEWIESFMIWLGPGQNGKGLLVRVLRELFGTYFVEMRLAILTEKGRSADSPSPAWMDLRGCRLAVISEAEVSQSLVSATVKILRDQTTIISCRDLRQSNVQWQPHFGMIICSNSRVKFTSQDGGIERSMAVIPYRFKFTGHISEPHHRQCDPALKQMAPLLAPQLLFLVMKFKQVFYPEGVVLGDSVIRPCPLGIVQASQDAMLGPLGGSTALEFLTDGNHCHITQIGAEASTVPQLIRAYLLYSETPYNRQSARAAGAELQQHAVSVCGPAGRACLRPLGAASGFFAVGH